MSLSSCHKYYEICALSELRGALRSGDIWVEHSRCYADPECYLIPQEEWPSIRPEVCRLLGLPTDGELRIRQSQKKLEANFIQLDQSIESQNGAVRVKMKNWSYRRLKRKTYRTVVFSFKT